MLTVKSTINIAGQTVPQIIPVVQGDTGRSILFTLADFTIPQGATATYYVQKPSGEAVYNVATIDGNTVLVELTAQSIIEHGDNYGQVRIENDGEIVTSFDFILLVKPFRGIDATQSKTEMNIFDKAVEQAEEAIDEAKDAALEEIAEAGSGNIAEEFDAANSYLAGEYTIYNAKLYRFTSNHTGSWSGSDAEEVTVGDELTDIKDGLSDSTLTFVSNYEGKTLVNNEALKTNGGIMSQTGRAHTAYINGSVPAKGISLDLSGYCFRIWYYTGITEGTFVKYDPNYYSGDGAIHWIGSEYKIRVCFYHDPVDTVEFTETELQNIKSNFKLYDYTDVIQDNKISEINNAINGINNALNFAYVTKVPLVLGSLVRNSGAPSFTYDTLLKYRSTPLISVDGDVRISCDENDSATITSFNIYQYKEDTKNSIQFVSAIRNLTFTDNAYTYTPSSDSIKYIRITLVLTENTQAKIQPLTLNSTAKVKICKNPNITTNSSGGNPRIELAYYVSGDTYTSGQLILPPNYTIDGKPCPLAVFFHGTTSMNTWDEAIGSSTSGIRNCLDYVTQEGFAVFDCYVFTSKYYSESGQHQGAPLPIFLEAYISGIKHICENYNVDSDNICFWANSAGANLGYLLAHSATDVVPRAIAMLSPSTGFASLIQRIFFLNQSMRNIIVNYLGLTNETNADVFISTNKGLDNANAVAFVEDHLDSFAGMICGAINAHGATFSDQYDWMMDGTTTLPAWMQDLPPIPADWTTSPATGIPKMVLHPELTMHSPIPIKYWQAFDDTNTCGYATYTIYQWLKNGGSNVHWRTMPNNTGGHHAVDIGEGALKSSGTTRLGIAYTDAPTAYVEMVDFFYQNMSQ